MKMLENKLGQATQSFMFYVFSDFIQYVSLLKEQMHIWLGFAVFFEWLLYYCYTCSV